MERRQVGVLLLAWLTACAGVPRVSPGSVDPHEAELAAARYELRVLTSGSGHTEPVELARADFERGMRVLARELRLSEQSADTARWLMAGGLQADLLAEVERGRVVRLTPLEEGSPLEASSAAEVKRRYLRMCQEEYGGGDCLELLTAGPAPEGKQLPLRKTRRRPVLGAPSSFAIKEAAGRSSSMGSAGTYRPTGPSRRFRPRIPPGTSFRQPPPRSPAGGVLAA